MKSRRSIKSFLIPLAISAILFFVSMQFSIFYQIIESIETFTYDLRFQLRQIDREDSKKINDIIIIDIDEKSIEKLGRFSSWPLAYYGKVVDYASKGEPFAIGFDIFFTEPDSLSFDISSLYANLISHKTGIDSTQIYKIVSSMNTESEFAASIKNSGIVYLGTFDNYFEEQLTNSKLPPNLSAFNLKKYDHLPQFKFVNNPVFPISPLKEAAKRIGFAHISPDADGTSRHYDTFFIYDSVLTVNFSMQMVLDILNIDHFEFEEGFLNLYSADTLVRSIPILENGSMNLNFYGEKKKFRFISFSDVLLNRISPKFFKDKIILIGSSAIGLHDLKRTPIDENYPGVELHATFLQNVLQQDFLTRTSSELKFLFWIFLLIFSVWLFNRFSISRTVISFVVLVIIASIGSYVAFLNYDHLFDLASTGYLLSLTFVTSILYRYQTEIRERIKVKRTFSKYLSASVVDEMLANPEKLRLGGEVRNITALFSDIQNFTILSEKVDPHDLTEFLKDYMTSLSKLVFDNNGMLDKYIGDAIVALFGVPLDLKNHADFACLTALEMKKVSKVVSERHTSHPLFATLVTRLGINTGKMIIGNMGSEQLFDYTAIGDNMNLAARLEGLNKFYGTEIMISEYTKNVISDSFVFREVDKVAVKGKSNGVRVFELFGHSEFTDRQEIEKFNELKHRFEESLQCYYDGCFEKSIPILESLVLDFPKDKSSEILLNRVNSLYKNKPEKWEGIWRMEEK